MPTQKRLDAFTQPLAASIRDAMAAIDRNASGIVLIVDAQQRLIGTVTDGDIRRAILAGYDLDRPVEQLLHDRPQTPKKPPLTASVDTPKAELLELMTERSIRQIPLLDVDGRVVDIVLWSELAQPRRLPVRAMVMAGGFGKRLHPLTHEMPKPMLPVGGRPLLEHIVTQLRNVGIHHMHVATHFKPEIIRDHFGDGENFGVKIEYTHEHEPLGTAGALGLLDATATADFADAEPLLVINGDILTTVNVSALLDFHREHDAEMTVGVRQYEIAVPYGVVETDGVQIVGLSEKPVIRHFVNAGVYLLEPAVRRLIPPNAHFNMTDLIERLLAADRRVISFPIREYWLDIGQLPDYERAQADVESPHFNPT